MQALDPAFILVAETTNYLKWTVFGGGTVQWKSWQYGCWAANPTPVGTHWSVTNCSHYGPYYGGGSTYVYHEATGKYKNTDWGDPGQATYVNHWSKIRGQNDGYFTY